MSDRKAGHAEAMPGDKPEWADRTKQAADSTVNTAPAASRGTAKPDPPPRLLFWPA